MFWATLVSRIVRKPMSLAKQQRVDAIQLALDEFFRLILPEWEDWLVTDESTVWDLNFDDGAQVRERIRAAYGVHVSQEDLDLFLWQLVEKLDKHRVSPSVGSQR